MVWSFLKPKKIDKSNNVDKSFDLPEYNDSPPEENLTSYSISTSVLKKESEEQEESSRLSSPSSDEDNNFKSKVEKNLKPSLEKNSTLTITFMFLIVVVFIVTVGNVFFNNIVLDNTTVTPMDFVVINVNAMVGFFPIVVGLCIVMSVFLRIFRYL